LQVLSRGKKIEIVLYIIMTRLLFHPLTLYRPENDLFWTVNTIRGQSTKVLPMSMDPK